MKLNIIYELKYNNIFYYPDENNRWYMIADGVKLPSTPLISYKKFNDSRLYKLVEDEKLISELERILEDGKEKTEIT